jgi:hypothetical protein
MATGTIQLLRRLASATAQFGAENKEFLELLAEVDAHLEQPMTSLDYCILYLERKVKRAYEIRGGCSLSIGLTEDILSHLKQKETPCQHHHETHDASKSTSASVLPSTSE